MSTMDVIDSRQQFKYEFIAGVPLIKTNDEINKESASLRKKPLVIPSMALDNSIETKPLEIIGLELNRNSHSKTDSSERSSIKSNQLIQLNSKIRFSRINQTMLQLPRRTTFSHSRRAANSFVMNKVWTPQTTDSNGQTTTMKSTTDEVSNMMHRTQSNGALNSTLTVLKKIPDSQLTPRLTTKKPPQSFLNAKREISPVKLPTLLKRTASTVIKPIPSAYIQDTSRTINRPVLQPTPVLPIYTPRRSTGFYADQNYLPLIRDQMVKANLNQRANFKCKSPAPHRSESSLSRSTTAGLTNSRQPTKAYNPLKSMDAGKILSESARHHLKRLFIQLDTDKDGHLTYPQVQKCLPSNLPRAQETFFRVLYDLTIDTTFFGLQEFYATAVLIDLIAKQDPNLWSKLLDDVDFNYYREDILELLDEFDHRASTKLTFDQLIATIQHHANNPKFETIIQALEKLLPSIRSMSWTRLEFIALLPSLIYIESTLDHGRPLFRFRENSILDLHMQRSFFV